MASFQASAATAKGAAGVTRVTPPGIIRSEPLAPVRQFPQFAVALAQIDTLDNGTAANAVDERIGALEARVAETTALRDAGVTPAGYLVALDYLLATMQTELSSLRGFADSLRSGGVERRLAADETEAPSQPEVTT